MTTINTIEDLARILRDQPTWAEALRALILTQDLMEVPNKLDNFIQEQREFNQEQREFNQETTAKLNNLEGNMGNLQGDRYERSVRSRAMARAINDLDFQDAYTALHQDGLTDPRLNSAAALAIRNGLITRDESSDLYDADIIISDQNNQHAVVEVSLTAGQNDINRAKTRAGIMAAITGGTVTPVVITSRLNPAQSAQAEAAGVTTFVIPYP